MDSFIVRFLGMLFWLLLSVQANAQVQFGVKAGGNVCNMKFDVDHHYGKEFKTLAKLGYHFGLVMDIPLMENTLSLQPALLYSNKGFEFDIKEKLKYDFKLVGFNNIDDHTGYIRNNYNYLEIPVNITYKYKSFQISAGPYFAIGVGGSFNNLFFFETDGFEYNNKDFYNREVYKIKPVFGTVDNEAYKDITDDEDVKEMYNGFDYGLNVSVGYHLNKMLFNMGYSLGLDNLTPRYDAPDYKKDAEYTEHVVQKNSVFNFSVSFFLTK